jgi:hypothetical protein
MKKTFSFLFILMTVITVLPASAQRGERFGIRAGYQTSGWYKNGSELTGTDPLNSFYVGVFKDNKLLPAVHFGIGLEYFQNGYTINSSNKRVLHMLSVPAYAKAKIGPVFGLAGIGANFAVSEKIYTNNVASSPSSDQKSKIVDFPLFIGAGVKISIFTIEARYHWGLVDINNGASNQYFQIGAGISL